jgi:hypothetical protein
MELLVLGGRRRELLFNLELAGEPATFFGGVWESDGRRWKRGRIGLLGQLQPASYF